MEMLLAYCIERNAKGNLDISDKLVLKDRLSFFFSDVFFFLGFGSVRILGVTPLGSSRSRLRAPLYGTPDYFHLGIGSPYFYLHWRSPNLPGIAISAGGDREPDVG